MDRRIIGLTGGSGVGKGEVCKILSEFGALVIDTDNIAHKVILKGETAFNEVLQEFGNEILADGGEISRKKLGALVFGDKAKLAKLSKIVHKYVIEETFRIISEAEEKLIVIDAPALVEADMTRHCDLVVGVFANSSTRLQRIMRRDGISLEAAKKRISSQMSVEELMLHVDFAIENNGSLAELKQSLLKILNLGGDE